MEQEYIYGVARIRALEGSLFTDETINQLVQCKDYDEAMDFLRTRDWGNGNPDQSLEEMLEQERRRTWKVLDELIEDKEQCEILTIANEYHNLKAAIKQVCTELETENVFYEDTKTDTEFLKNCIRQGNYNLLPKGMEQAAKDATTVLMQTGDGQLCDVIIDRATLEAIKSAGNEASNEMIKKYADDLITISDIKIAVRCAATNKDTSFISKALVSCDGISVTELISAAREGLEGVCSYLEKIGYGQAVEALKVSKSVFECWCDNKIIENIKSQKYDSFSIGPIIAYVIARENEIKTVKIILSGKINGFDNEFMHKVAVIGDYDSIYGFSALGLDTFPVTDVTEAAHLLRKIAAGEYAIIYITEMLAKQLSAEIEKYREQMVPAIILIPGVKGNTGDGVKGVKDCVEQAIGSDIVFGKE